MSRIDLLKLSELERLREGSIEMVKGEELWGPALIRAWLRMDWPMLQLHERIWGRVNQHAHRNLEGESLTGLSIPQNCL